MGIGVLGGGVGLLGVTAFAGRLTVDMLWLAAATAASATLVAGTAAVVPALTLRRLPLSTLLAED